VRDGLLSLEQACNRFLLGRRISCQYSVGWHGLRACALHASRKYRPRSPGLYPPMQVTLAVRRRMVLSHVGAAAVEGHRRCERLCATLRNFGFKMGIMATPALTAASSSVRAFMVSIAVIAERIAHRVRHHDRGREMDDRGHRPAADDVGH